MSYILQPDIDVVYEILSTLYYISNESNLSKKLEESLIKSGIDKENYNKKNLKNFYKFLDKFKAKLTVPMNTINFYFEDITGEDIGFSSIGSCILSNFNLENLNLYKEAIKNIRNEELERLVIADIVSNLSDSCCHDGVKDVKTRDDFWDYLISNDSLTEKAKWTMMVIIKNVRTYLIELIDVVLDLVDTFKECYKILEKDKNKFINDLTTWFNEDINFFKNITGIDIEFNEDILLFPSLVNFKSIAMEVKDDNLTNLNNLKTKGTIHFGWKFKELIDLSNETNDSMCLFHDKLKCLSDKSKFDIIQMLKEKPLYGQEIAERLSLTTATVSYHMNALILSGLVYMNKVNNKIYYNINKSNVDEFLNKLAYVLKS